MMPEIILLPNGQLLITDGGETGYAAIASVANPFGNVSNCGHPVLTPSLYSPDAPLGQRISNTGMPTTDVARLYHSAVTLTPSGCVSLHSYSPLLSYSPFLLPLATSGSEARIPTRTLATAPSSSTPSSKSNT